MAILRLKMNSPARSCATLAASAEVGGIKRSAFISANGRPCASMEATFSMSATKTRGQPAIADASRLTEIVRIEWLQVSFIELTEIGSKPARRQESMQLCWYAC